MKVQQTKRPKRKKKKPRSEEEIANISELSVQK